eukprot:gnl/TRDRNA2_/TRDRNA2_116431_c0_seq1.p1 gnl/TRDRNA2_/TRDRNA2_116431_c0~~gnl/TRDRNA2_/TRDRNA2_116431_c0_seq1.p1  ORF type:complete len:320 (+),score=66.26 gnl/TRDRNA2_/TRDRNA2_116431_c0_seq1:133-1092(+)
MAADFILEDVGGSTDSGCPAAFTPAVRLRGYGTWMPLRGLGTNGFQGKDAAAALERFVRHGGRLLDTALLYENHRDLARALPATGVSRADTFIMSKLPPGLMGFEETRRAIDTMLEELETSYLDLVLIHWPAMFDPAARPPACASQPGGWPGCRQAAWRAMEESVELGKVRALGVSNFGTRHLRDILEMPGRKFPVAVNQVEFHPWWPQHSLRRFCKDHGIAISAYGSLGGSLMGGAMLRAPAVEHVAKRHGRSPAQVLLRWALQQDVLVIPSASSESHVRDNLDIVDWELDDNSMRLLGSVEAQDWFRAFMPDPENAP